MTRAHVPSVSTMPCSSARSSANARGEYSTLSRLGASEPPSSSSGSLSEKTERFRGFGGAFSFGAAFGSSSFGASIFGSEIDGAAAFFDGDDQLLEEEDTQV